MRQVMSGVYTILPFGLRTMRKIETIVREEMDAAGSIELRMPMILPADPWRATGRYDLYGETLFKLTDRHDRDLILGPTQEEVVALMAAADMPSSSRSIEYASFIRNSRTRSSPNRGRNSSRYFHSTW